MTMGESFEPVMQQTILALPSVQVFSQPQHLQYMYQVKNQVQQVFCQPQHLPGETYMLQVENWETRMNRNPWSWSPFKDFWSSHHLTCEGSHETPVIMKWKWSSGRGHSSWQDQPARQRSEDVQAGRIFSTRQRAKQCPWTCRPPRLWQHIVVGQPDTSQMGAKTFSDITGPVRARGSRNPSAGQLIQREMVPSGRCQG